MAHTDTCRIEVCQEIERRKAISGGVRPAIREISKEMGIPQGTLKDWYYPDRCPKTRTPGIADVSKQFSQTCAETDLQTLIASGQKFGTVYADPPWQYSNQATRSSTNKAKNQPPDLTAGEFNRDE